LRASDSAAALLAAIDGNRTLLQAVREALPPPLDAHCLFAGIADGTLTLVTDAPAWSSRLRFFAPELLSSLQCNHGPIETTRIRVQPTCAPRAPRERDGSDYRLSERTVRLLRDTAEGLGETDLARALRRLADAGDADSACRQPPR
jgi:hypothetical protein